MIDVAKAKGWDLNKVQAQGSPEFKKEAQQQIKQELQRQKQVQQQQQKEQQKPKNNMAQLDKMKQNEKQNKVEIKKDQQKDISFCSILLLLSENFNLNGDLLRYPHGNATKIAAECFKSANQHRLEAIVQEI